ncbi:MAG: hypothetical protein HONBIEJF_00628 [Fimbriimonadaceae bacterium]|nr:hypothetical protein [Fimbriimonadaceae bacterium]
MRREIVDWEFQVPDGRWLPAEVPGCIHLDLLRHGFIPEPFAECNERELQWIGERAWRYRARFNLTSRELDHVRLCFDGLDAVARVQVNGTLVAECAAMFVPLQPRTEFRIGDNLIEIEFLSAVEFCRMLESLHGVMEVWNGDPHRVYIRKAQYHFGWDWGPTFITCGIWRPVWLEWTDCLFKPTVRTELQGESGFVEVAWLPECGSNAYVLEVEVVGPGGDTVGRTFVPLASGRASLTVTNPARWGLTLGTTQPPEQAALYRVVMRSEGFGEVECRLGFRSVELRQDGCFDFWVNGGKLFCGGANWIPADSFPTRVTPDRYRELLTAAKEAGMSMIRVWGGGIYEEDFFYDVCDELELLVWQDFMFACGMYPGDTEYLNKARNEATAQLQRLTHHPCIALWCGNNEDYQIAGNRYKEHERPSVESAFPARVIYESVLPQAVSLADPNAIYVPGSPFGGPDANSPTIGDRHVWEVWHGAKQPYQDYPKHGGLFVSEFGMGSYPDLQTLEPWIEDRSIGSEPMRWHHKALGGDDRITYYLSESLPVPEDPEVYAFYTQIVQAEAMRYAYEGFRRDGSGGALVWQLNDCWPTISWSIIDYDLRPKPAYYTIKRTLRPMALSALLENGRLRIAVMNGTAAPWNGVVTVDGVNRELGVGPTSVVEIEPLPMGDDVVEIRLCNLDRRVVWPEPLKKLTPVECVPTVSLVGDKRLRIESEAPTPFVWIQTDTPARWNDNLLHLLPGEPIEIAADRKFERYRLWWLGGRTDWLTPQPQPD